MTLDTGPNVEVLVITKRELDDLRRFNVEMRRILKALVDTAGSDHTRFYQISFDAYKLLVAQRLAGFMESATK